MAIYTDKQSLLDETLGKYKDYGFELIEPDDHFLELWFKDKRIAIYNQTAWTSNKSVIEIIRKGCENYLKSIAGWD